MFRRLKLTGKRHHLVEFIMDVFGKNFGRLLLAGYGEREWHPKTAFYFEERINRRNVMYEIRLSEEIPFGEEPLVLAALIKLMFDQGITGKPFLAFDTEDLVEEIGWERTADTEQKVDKIIKKYLSMKYIRRETTQSPPYEVGPDLATCRMITSYVKSSVQTSRDGPLLRDSNFVFFDWAFIQGLKSGIIFFSNLILGRVKIPKG